MCVVLMHFPLSTLPQSCQHRGSFCHSWQGALPPQRPCRGGDIGPGDWDLLALGDREEVAVTVVEVALLH